jgi:hypothetical protein
MLSFTAWTTDHKIVHTNHVNDKESKYFYGQTQLFSTISRPFKLTSFVAAKIRMKILLDLRTK